MILIGSGFALKLANLTGSILQWKRSEDIDEDARFFVVFSLMVTDDTGLRR